MARLAPGSRGLLWGIPLAAATALAALGSCDGGSAQPAIPSTTTTHSVEVDCSIDVDCPIGEICSIGLCVEGCRPGTDRCPDGEICSQMRCVAAPPDAGSDAEADAPSGDADATTGDCPADMVQLSATSCMDRYEASRANADDTWAGDDESVATSRSDVLPWYPVPFATAAAACAAADKRLCTPEEFVEACAGATDRRYVYGDVYEPATCNGSDTFCPCGAGSACEGVVPCPYPRCYNLPPEGAALPPTGCGSALRTLPTGSLAGCVSPEGIYDLNGNVWELVDDGTVEGQYRGGAFNCIDSVTLHQCSYVGIGISARGFRCCLGL